MENQDIEQQDTEMQHDGNVSKTHDDGKESKKAKNMLSVAILASGLFIGSLFVDFVQLVNGNGFSERAVENATVLETGGKTWVAYDEPRISVDVITDATCEKCDPKQALVWLQRIMPTIMARQIDYASEEGKALVEKTGIIALPAFVFSNEVNKTDMFAQAESFFVQQDDSRYVLSTEQLGMPTGKLLATPEIRDNDIQIGSQDAPISIVEFSDFECPYCQLFHPAIKQLLVDYKDKVRFSYKHYPLSFHPQANIGALASECANEQGKFMEYADRLFERQSEWSKATDVKATLKGYAVSLGLKKEQFNTCLDTEKYQDKIDADAEEGKKFGVNGTPGTFINDEFVGGVVGIDELKQIIDQKLAQ